MSDLQELRGCQPYFLLCQVIQPHERVFDIRLPDQLLEILFLIEDEQSQYDGGVLGAHLSALVLFPSSR